MRVFTETPSRRCALFEPGLEAFAEAERDAGRQLVPVPRRRGRPTVVLDVGHIDVVARHPDLHTPVRERGRQLGGGTRQEIEDTSGRGTAEEVGDPLGHLGHRLVPELPDRDHVGTEPVDHE